MLLYDIENSPMGVWVWPGSLYERDVIRVVEDWYMLTIAWKWLGQTRVSSLALEKEKDDYNLCAKLHTLFDEADVIVAHNGDGFDKPKAYTRLIQQGFDPPSPSKTIDTLKVARRHFQFNSNKLDALGDTLGVGRKAPSGGFDTWEGCMALDPKAIARMKR